MTETSRTLLHRVALVGAAFPILAWDALALGMILTVCVQLFTGFEDFPVIPMLYSLPLGAVIGLILFGYVCVCARRKSFRVAWAIVGAATLFAILSIPIGRAITNIVEH